MHPIVEVLNTRFNGVVVAGAHVAGEEKACILEVCSLARGLEVISSSPEIVQLPDIRALNDAYTDDAARTAAMVRLGVALWSWPEWTAARRRAFATALAVATVRELLPPALRVIGCDDEAAACEAAADIIAAGAAARAAYAAAAAADAAAEAAAHAAARAAYDAARAAYDAARATYAAARAVARAAHAAARAAHAAADARTATLDSAVAMWIRCAEETA